MANLKPFTGYKGADEMLGKRNQLRLGHNTRLERWPARPDAPPSQGGKEAFAVYYHTTPVLSFYADGSIFINTGGWDTVTTRQRLDEYLSPLGFRVHRVKGKTRITDMVKGWENAPFYDFNHQAKITPKTREVIIY